MKNFVKVGVAVLGAVVLAGCSVQTSDRVNVDPSSIKYVQDSRTGLCFAATASRKAANLETTGLGLTHVPCTEDVLKLVK